MSAATLDADGFPIENATVIVTPEWQPIETAPKDGTLVIAAWDAETDPSPEVERIWIVTAAYWMEGFDGSVEEPAYPHAWMQADECIPVEPTHWMPLPEPPTDSSTTA